METRSRSGAQWGRVFALNPIRSAKRESCSRNQFKVYPSEHESAKFGVEVQNFVKKPMQKSFKSRWKFVPFNPRPNRFDGFLHRNIGQGNTKVNALITSDLTVMSLLALAAAGGQIAEQRTKWGSRMSSAIVALVVAMVCASVGILPPISGAYDVVWKYLMPMAVALALLGANFKDLAQGNGRIVLKAFLVGALGSIVGTFVSFFITGELLGANGWRVAACLCASYIGGSLNYASTAQALGMSAIAEGGTGHALLAAGMAADNLAMAFYLAILMAIPAVPPQDTVREDSEDTSEPVTVSSSPTTVTVMGSIAAALVVLDVSQRFASAIGQPSLSLGVAGLLTPLGVILLSFLYRKLSSWSSVTDEVKVDSSKWFAGASVLSGALMLLFFATLGAGVNVATAVSVGGPVLLFIAVQLLTQLGISLLVGNWILKIPRWAVILAANANVGGPATAAAMATARGWKNAVQPAILTGTFGYTIGTVVGCAVANSLLFCPTVAWYI